MEHRTVASSIWVSSLILIQIHITSQQTLTHRISNKNESERKFLFPDTNATGHYLPVFPDPVVEYVGREQPLAPSTDEFGRPLCMLEAGDTFCEKVENYPETQIRNAINYSSDEFLELFGSSSITSRKSIMNEDTVCEQQSKIFYPRAAANENDEWTYVVNDNDYVQTVMAEICVNANHECRYLEGNLPPRVTSRCRQKYAYKRLLALHPNKKKTYTDSFRFPSCCACYVKRSFLSTRLRAIEVEEKNTTKKPPTRSRRNSEKF
ncbi:protein spaetzle [Nephila pilipes]|uniref:Protein spaetzle n=1 Tax=Nephila pilipes TaxID=299642 RepID=A0A8X6QXK2_NEPPI|nr:protein spaetzle [Nephila pilipes]